mgnify:CR=1 FL=1
MSFIVNGITCATNSGDNHGLDRRKGRITQETLDRRFKCEPDSPSNGRCDTECRDRQSAPPRSLRTGYTSAGINCPCDPGARESRLMVRTTTAARWCAASSASVVRCGPKAPAAAVPRRAWPVAFVASGRARRRRYVEACRAVQSCFGLEPAGSKGTRFRARCTARTHP